MGYCSILHRLPAPHHRSGTAGHWAQPRTIWRWGFSVENIALLSLQQSSQFNIVHRVNLDEFGMLTISGKFSGRQEHLGRSDYPICTCDWTDRAEYAGSPPRPEISGPDSLCIRSVQDSDEINMIMITYNLFSDNRNWMLNVPNIV